MIVCIQDLVSFCLFILKILSKNQILTSIKGVYSVENLRKMTLHIPNIDLVNDNVYTRYEPRREKTNVLVSNLARHKPGCTATEDAWKLEISDLESRGIVLSK